MADRRPIHVHAHPDVQFPLRSSPVKFAVRLMDGRLSNLWTVEARGKKGDVYICSRDLESETKISLHASGQQHVVFRRSPHNKMVWKEPPMKSPTRASVKLFFTVWSAGVRPTKDYSHAKWSSMLDKNHVLIEGGCSEDTVITVGFFLTPPNVTINWHSRPPQGPVAVLPVSADKELHIIARREHRPHLRAGLEAKMNADTPRRAVSGCGPTDTPYLRLLAGQDVDGVHYVAAVTVIRNVHGVELVECRQAVVNVD